MKYNFTDRTRRVLASAREEAIRLQHDYVGTEHILLGLLREPDGSASAALQAMGARRSAIGESLRKAVMPGNRPVPRGELPYTSRAKKVLEISMAEARHLGSGYVGTEHLLLGLVEEEKGIAAAVLRESGVSGETLRATVRSLLGGGPGRTEAKGIQPREAGTSKRDSAWYLLLDEESSTPIYEQIVVRIEEAVATGRLEPGERLPSVRDLAAELEIAPGTVARSYSELEKRGVVQTEGSKGTRVAESRPSPNGKDQEGGWLEAALRRMVVAAFHRGATAREMREALERAMHGILKIL